MASVGPHESVGGDIKFLRLKQREIGGLVTDGSVRDTDEIINYGFPVSFLCGISQKRYSERLEY